MSELNRIGRYIVFGFFVAFAIWFFLVTKPLFPPLIIAALLAYILNPMVNRSAALLRCRRETALFIIYPIFLGLIIFLPLIFSSAIVTQVKQLVVALEQTKEQLQISLTEFITLWNLPFDVDLLFMEIEFFVAQFLQPEKMFRVLGSVSTNLAWILVVLSTTFYFLKDGGRLKEWFIALFPDSYQLDIARLVDESDRVWRAYLRGQWSLMLIVGTLSAIVGSFLGLPQAGLLGFLAGVLDFIPSIGPMVAMLLAAGVAWLKGSTVLSVTHLSFSIIVFLAYTIIQTIENVWLRPQIMKQAMAIHPGIIFVVVMGAFVLSGTLAALIVIPSVGTLFIWGRYWHRQMLGRDPWDLSKD